MIAILIGASHDTTKSGNVPLSSGSFEFITEGLVDSLFIIEQTGQKVEDHSRFIMSHAGNINLLRIKEGSERQCINIHINRI